MLSRLPASSGAHQQAHRRRRAQTDGARSDGRALVSRFKLPFLPPIPRATQVVVDTDLHAAVARASPAFSSGKVPSIRWTARWPRLTRRSEIARRMEQITAVGVDWQRTCLCFVPGQRQLDASGALLKQAVSFDPNDLFRNDVGLIPCTHRRRSGMPITGASCNTPTAAAPVSRPRAPLASQCTETQPTSVEGGSPRRPSRVAQPEDV